MDSKLLRDICLNKYVTAIWRGFIWLVLGFITGLLWIVNRLTLTIDEISRLLNTDTHIITHVIYRSWPYGQHSRRYLKCLTLKNIQHALLSFQVHDTIIFNRKWLRFCVSFEIIILSSARLAHSCARVTSRLKIQLISKHLTCCIRHCFTGMTIVT